MSDPRIERAYKKQLERQAANVARNEAEGRNIKNIAKSFEPLEPSTRALNLKDVVSGAQARHNLEDTVKTVKGFDPELNAGIKGGKIDMIRRALGVAEDVTEPMAPEANSILKNTKGFAKLLPMLGLGGTALAASSIFNKARAGDTGEAAMEAANEVSDYVPGVGTAKMALNSEALGEGEDAALRKLEMQNRSAQTQNPETRRFQKIKDLMK